MIHGSIAVQYRRLSDYAEEIRRTNEGSIVKMFIDSQQPDSEPIFKRFYVYFAVCK